ncbi:MAG: GspE/PulE family protein [Rikenellaceae bacterium]|nr:GspE/PulE family protein [Rikenellaceae bacterium]
MNTKDRIPTEVLQLMPPSLAWDYRLLPYLYKEGTIHCYSDCDDPEKRMELEVLHGLKVEIKKVSKEKLEQLLSQYYRDMKSTDTAQNAVSVTDISSGQGFLYSLIEEAFDSYASDIHIEPYEQRCRIRMRIDGKLIERYVVHKSNYASLVNQIKILANLDISEKRLPQDGRILFDRNGKKFDVRVSTLPTIYGEKSVLRLLTRHVELLELANLGFTPRQLEDYTAAIVKPHGMVLICGPTGSGKSTTLYATLRMLNNNTGNIVTIEDPVEYTLEGVNQVQLKEEIGLTFTSALRTFLRQDPDIIMLGEIRDPDTAQMAVRSSLTGHLLFSTIHTNSAWGSISRLADMGIHPYLIANTLILCVAQRLIRLLCPECKSRIKADRSWKAIVGLESTGFQYIPKGCAKCYYTGYSGRKAIYEVIPVDETLAAAIRDNVPDIHEILRQRNITTLKTEGIRMVAAGESSFEEIIPLLND